ncbi:MAG: D-alanyl-D-alanine carboxypeptidase [Ruminococcus sp.]|nr:D-alanyl-D-alanine carboxypeptidase [Ruminococcus sp.]
MKRKTEIMKSIAANHTGNAALCAILIMIMLLAIGTAALVVTGRSQIDENKRMPEKNIVIETSDAGSVQQEPEEPEEVQPLMIYPEKDFDFMKMELPDVTAKYSVLLDVTNNKLYTARNYTKKAYPASLTKLMTIIVAIEHTDNLKDTYKFTKQDIQSLEDENASVAGFKAGEKVTVEDLLYGAMLPSGADATLGLANYVAGSEEAFVKLMNDKVEELGLTGTHFTNASGLHDEDHYSTAMDMAMIVKYGLETEGVSKVFTKVISAESYTTKKSNKNKEGILLSSIFFQRYEGFFIDRDEDGRADAKIIGGKTGFTDESKYSLASVYEVDGEYYVCVTLKSADSGKATMDNVAIAERYLPTYDLIEPTNKSDSSIAESKTDSGVVDATPEPIDQTDSTEGTESAPEDQTESTDAEAAGV